MLTEQELRSGLTTKVFGRKIYTFDTIDSTNNCAKALAGCWAQEGTVVLADYQTAGRGRLGRSWTANAQENLMFSVILRPDLKPEAVNLLPLYTAVAVAEAVEHLTSLSVECKWPNDLLLSGKKVAGILLEGSLKDASLEFVVIGVGINVNQSAFPKDLRGKATSLRVESKRDIDRTVLFREILTSLEKHYAALRKRGFQSVLPLWLSRSTMLNKQISVSEHGAVLTGIVKGLNAEGALLLHSEGGDKALYAGDVTILSP